MAVVSLSYLLEAGVHFGHQTKRWNPKMKEYIYTTRDDIYIIDLQKTLGKIEEAYAEINKIAANGGTFLFVGTKKQAQEAAKENAERTNSYYVTERWLGGTLTNFRTIRSRVKRLEQIEKMEKDGTFDVLPKKEVIELKKEYEKLNKLLCGIRAMDKLPQAMIIVDPKKELNAIREARKLNIPIFGIVDTNCDPDDVDYVIPGNDDAVRAVKVVLGVLGNAIAEVQGGEIIDYVTEEDKKTKFHLALTRYCRQLKKRSDVTDVERLVVIIKMSEDQLRASYLLALLNPKEEPDFDFDTTTPATETTTPTPAPSTVEDLIAQAELLFNPIYNEDKVKQAFVDLLKQQFVYFRGVKFAEFEDVVDVFFKIVARESIEDLDGLNESIPDALNKYFFARNNPVSLKNIFKSILLDLEPYLRKICFLKNGKVFGQYDGFVPVAREITEFSYLYNTRDPNLAQFKGFYNVIYGWRNDNAHLAPKLPNDEVDGAIFMVLCMYAYATMVSMDELDDVI